MRSLCTTMLLVLACTGSMLAANVKVVMNSTSKTMSLTDKATGQTVETGEPDKLNYAFETPAGTYVLTAYAADGETVNGTIEINVTDSEEEQTFDISMIAAADNAWDGTNTAEPVITDGVYQIGTGAELAWYAADVNGGNNGTKAVITADIDLGDFDWTPIGGSSATKAYKGDFDGQGHTVSGLYINDGTATYQGLFGYLAEASVRDVTVEGCVTAKTNVGGVVAYLGANATIDRCANKADITATGNYIGGIAANTIGTSKITNCYNTGNITGVKYCAGIAGNATAIVENCFNIGKIKGDNAAACLNGSQLKEENIKNVFAITEYDVTTGHTLVTEEQMASGEVAYLLGEAFGQKIGEDAHPVISGMKVYITANNEYTNEDPTAIHSIHEVAGATTTTGIYTVNGVKTTGLQPGVNIIRMGNGTTKKIIVK